MKIEEFEKEFIELFSFEISQKLTLESPKDTGRMSRTFMGTVKVNGNTISWELPYYWEYVEFIANFKSGKPNKNFAFTRRTLINNADEIAERVFKKMANRN
jgi:hypothetical protein